LKIAGKWVTTLSFSL